MEDLRSYIPLIKFFGQFLGTDAELILYDTKKEMIEFVYNPFNSQNKEGSPIPEMEKRFIAQELFKQEEFIVNYRAFSTERNKLRSASYFIKNSEDELIGILTINYKVDELIELRSTLNRLISGSEQFTFKGENFYESFNLSFEDLMNNTIQDALKKYNVPPDRLSHDEKMDLIRTLDEKGTFLLKGSVAELAKVLQTSETSIYRYINKL